MTTFEDFILILQSCLIRIPLLDTSFTNEFFIILAFSNMQINT